MKAALWVSRKSRPACPGSRRAALFPQPCSAGSQTEGNTALVFSFTATTQREFVAKGARQLFRCQCGVRTGSRVRRPFWQTYSHRFRVCPKPYDYWLSAQGNQSLHRPSAGARYYKESPSHVLSPEHGWAVTAPPVGASSCACRLKAGPPSTSLLWLCPEPHCKRQSCLTTRLVSTQSLSRWNQHFK